MRRLVRCTVLFVLYLATTIGCSSHPAAPVAAASPHVQVVRVTTGSSCGWCTGGGNSTTTTIEPGSLSQISEMFSNKHKWKYKITKEDWEDLQGFFDEKAIAAFTGQIGCPGCADESVEWAEVEFSDGTKISVSYNAGNAPGPIAALRQKVQNIASHAVRQEQARPVH